MTPPRRFKDSTNRAADYIVRRSRYARTRASGLPSTSRSPITATLSAPASMTAGARLERNATNRHERQAGRTRGPGSFPYAVEADRRGCWMASSACRTPGRSRGNFTGWPTAASTCSCVWVDKPTIAGSLTSATNQGRREVVLPDVHAVRAAQPCDIGAVVDDHVRVRPVRQRHDRRRRVEQPSAWRRLRAKLQERGAPAEKRRRQIDHRSSLRRGRHRRRQSPSAAASFMGDDCDDRRAR